ncbi:hypothetical protein BC567DRAFT_80742 [Phyllosticta citribraziliensis]
MLPVSPPRDVRFSFSSRSFPTLSVGPPVLHLVDLGQKNKPYDLLSDLVGPLTRSFHSLQIKSIAPGALAAALPFWSRHELLPIFRPSSFPSGDRPRPLRAFRRPGGLTNCPSLLSSTPRNQPVNFRIAFSPSLVHSNTRTPPGISNVCFGSRYLVTTHAATLTVAASSSGRRHKPARWCCVNLDLDCG